MIVEKSASQRIGLSCGAVLRTIMSSSNAMISAAQALSRSDIALTPFSPSAKVYSLCKFIPENATYLIDFARLVRTYFYPFCTVRLMDVAFSLLFSFGNGLCHQFLKINWHSWAYPFDNFRDKRTFCVIQSSFPEICSDSCANSPSSLICRSDVCLQSLYPNIVADANQPNGGKPFQK